MTLCCLTSNTKTRLYANSSTQHMCLCGVTVPPEPADWSLVMSARGTSSPQTLNLHKIKRSLYICDTNTQYPIGHSNTQDGYWKKRKKRRKKGKKERRKKKHQFSPHFPLSEKEKTTVPHPAFFSHYSNGFIARFPIHWREKLVVSRHKSPSLLVYNTSLGQEMHITHQTTWLHQYPFCFSSIGFQGFTSPIWK